MKQVLVGGVPVNDAAGIMKDFWDKIGKSISWDEFKRFLKRENPFQEDWLNPVLAREKKLHQDFFGKRFAGGFDYSLFSATLEKYGEAKFAEWKELGLEPHFLPFVEMSQDKNFPGWRIKPENWFYEKIAEGKVLGEPLLLGGQKGQVVLIDTRCKPVYKNGEQMWDNDILLGGIIQDLREKCQIEGYQPEQSRFYISVLEIEQKIIPLFAQKLGFESNQVRLEKCIEFNVISQILADTPRARDGKTNTWLGFADHFESAEDRWRGGYSDGGGLADVDYGWAGGRWGGGSFRLLAVL